MIPLKVSSHVGNFFVRSSDLLALPAIDRDKVCTTGKSELGSCEKEIERDRERETEIGRERETEPGTEREIDRETMFQERGNGCFRCAGAGDTQYRTQLETTKRCTSSF